MKFLLMMVGAVALPAFAADLQTSDVTGVTFWLVTAAMLAATVFFFVEETEFTANGKHHYQWLD